MSLKNLFILVFILVAIPVTYAETEDSNAELLEAIDKLTVIQTAIFQKQQMKIDELTQQIAELRKELDAAAVAAGKGTPCLRTPGGHQVCLQDDQAPVRLIYYLPGQGYGTPFHSF